MWKTRVVLFISPEGNELVLFPKKNVPASEEMMWRSPAFAVKHSSWMFRRLRQRWLLRGFESMAPPPKFVGRVEGKQLVIEYHRTDEFGELHVKEKGRIPLRYIKEWHRTSGVDASTLVVEFPGTGVMDELDAFISTNPSAASAPISPPPHPDE
jgi:hypothetical protein